MHVAWNQREHASQSIQSIMLGCFFFLPFVLMVGGSLLLQAQQFPFML